MRNGESDPAAGLVAAFKKLDPEEWLGEMKHLLRSLHRIFEEKTKHLEHPWVLPTDLFTRNSEPTEKKGELVEVFGELDDQEWLDEIGILLRATHIILAEKTSRLAEREVHTDSTSAWQFN